MSREAQEDMPRRTHPVRAFETCAGGKDRAMATLV
jgi:hypothetical protein